MITELETERDQWKRCAAPMLDAYLDRSGQLGAEVMAGYRKILVDAHRTTPVELRQDRVPK